MWYTPKSEQSNQLDVIFSDLYVECRRAAPGAQLSYNVRNILERLPRIERKLIVSRKKEGCAPLFLGCKKGNVEIVEYLIQVCDADVEQRGVYEVSDDHSVHVVTPLWCAAVAGKLSVVRCLVEHGANVNSLSDTGSTPVRSACFMTHFEIVKYLVENNADIQKPNYNGGTCLINSVQSVPLCKYLLKHGADVNAQDIQFKTALHYAIQEHRFETTTLLLAHGANPLIKSRYGDDALQTACLKGARQIFEYLIKHGGYSHERIADAYELMGTTFIDDHNDTQNALYYWRKGFEYRQYHRLPNPQPQSVVGKPSYMVEVQFQTLEDYENLVLDVDARRMQSLVICERILGLSHKDLIFRIMHRGAAYADSLKYQRCIDLWRYALELRIQKDSLLHPETCFASQALVQLLLDLYEKHEVGILREELQYWDVIQTVKLLFSQFDNTMKLLSIRPVFKRQQDGFDKILKIITHLFYILHVIPKTEEQDMEMKKVICGILRMNPCNSAGDSLLHLVVSKSNTFRSNSFFEEPHTTSLFPSPSVAHLLLECGANVEATNQNMSTPLHFASLRVNFNPQVIGVLLKHGAHLDHRNSNGNQPYRMLAGNSEATISPLQYINLKCLAARKIIEKRIPFVGRVPVTLESFIEIH
ncbi:protein fem-1 homolog C-like [Limulus polyphemus]|uniref:Protein fem-1 homolog C-like n=1 Tax=Limulus polyphemus TaxID=6850 RepID=A0ABM1BPK6_LIMPO|nr:protein fem-1 homolog C-like [Limulus polyphemus]